MSADPKNGIEGGYVRQVPDVVLLYAAVSASGSGANILVAAVAARRICVCNYLIVAAGAVGVKWVRGSTDISGVMQVAATGGVASPVASPGLGPLFKTGVNEDLVLNLSAAVSVGGHLSYYLEVA